ncbi:MAG TPA: cupin domain-containing protein, partial [Candidatus Bathyarchaeota archaeon]|nr:cupin domain-containing protein [Candidatus Bathyarchaeota archaeon]
GGGKEVEFGAGDVLFIPPNEPHEFVNIGDEKLVFLCMIPAGVNLKEIKTLPER